MKLTMKEIADLAGVSKTTVSQILNDKGERFSEETRQRVLQIIEDYRYAPNYFASNLVKNKSGLIGIIVPSIKEPFASTLITKIQANLTEAGFHLMTIESSGEEEEEIALFERYCQISVEAILCFTATKFSEEFVQRSSYHGIPIVFVDQGINESQYGHVYLNEYDTVRKAIADLIQKKHQTIGLIKENQENYIFPNRTKAYFDALNENNLVVDPSIIVETDFSIDAGYHAAKQIAQNPNVSAIFCCDDTLALGCYQGIYDLGLKVNEDIEIIGFDGIEMLQHVRPQIRTLQTPFTEFANVLSEKILQAVNSPNQKQKDCYLKMIF